MSPAITEHPAAVVLPTGSARSALRPLTADRVRLRGGFWGQRRQLNRERSLRHGFEQLESAGNLHNLRLAGGLSQGSYRALGVMFEGPFPFLDSDVYKWLEACGWELGRADDEQLRTSADEVIELIARAQRPDGYINTFVQVLAPGREYRDLHWGHELYCIGHLIQAAVAWQRSLGDERLLQIALGAVESVERELGPAGREGIDGHPEIEMALVELYRLTGDRRHLELAARFIDLRGEGLLGEGRFGAAYWQDHQGVREATVVAGHAVRQLYLDCGVVDLAAELGDLALLEAALRRWRDMLATRSYLTGGLGSRHRDEAFGDPYELPPDLAYNETCAAIASVMLAWRLLLATGDPLCADVIERTMFNGVLPGLALSGTEFFYVNPLQRRSVRAHREGGHEGRRAGRRQAWYACACCPPNLMRLLASWEQYFASSDEQGVRLHQYAALELSAPVAGGEARLDVQTEYPWRGAVTVTVLETPPEPWTLSLRVPDWCDDARATISAAGVGAAQLRRDGRLMGARRKWRAGERVELQLAMPPRLTEPDPRIDAIRGCLAVERGPLVYCLETEDLPAGTQLEQVEIAADARPSEIARPDIAEDLIGLRLPALRRPAQPSEWPYRRPADEDAPASGPPDRLEVGAIPYFAWGNRDAEAMRVWVPVRWAHAR